MPTTHIGPFGVVTSSQAVASVNQTGEAMFGMPFIVTHKFGDLTFSPVVVNAGASSTTVHVVGFTSTRPEA